MFSIPRPVQPPGGMEFAQSKDEFPHIHRRVAFQKGSKDMTQPEIQLTLTKMVQVILRHQPGFVPLGNVWMEWDGHTLSWDIPLKEWDVDAVCHSLIRQATPHPEVEYLAKIAEGFSHL